MTAATAGALTRDVNWSAIDWHSVRLESRITDETLEELINA